MRALNHILFMLLILLARPASALWPETGWWWNSSQGGRGFNIEVQNDSMFFAGYLYAPGGAPVWYVAQGNYNSTTNTFTGPLLAFANGPCIACPYSPPTQTASPGTLSLQFNSSTTGVLTWPGGSIPITRFVFGVEPGARRFEGLWAISTHGQSGAVQFGNWITWTGSITDPALGVVKVGVTEGGRTVVAAGNAADTEVSVLVDASATTWNLYRIPTTFFAAEKLGGLYFGYVKGSTATGNGGLAAGLQVIQGSQTNLSGAPAEAKAAPADLGELIHELYRVTRLPPADFSRLQ